MIRLTRDRSPSVIHANYKLAKRKEFETDLMEQDRAIRRGDREKREWNSGRWKPSKEQLLIESHNKCAYCEAPTAQVAYGDVEHYRPKSKYWWLAYCYENYLVSCTLCNRSFKSDKFPIAARKLRPPVSMRRTTSDSYIARKAGTLGPDSTDQASADVFIATHKSERPSAINPYHEDPEPFFAWEADDVIRQVRLLPRDDTADTQRYVKAAEEVYGLNRTELCELRYFFFNLFRTFKLAGSDPGISAATKAQITATIDGMKSAQAPFAGMIRFFDATM